MSSYYLYKHCIPVKGALRSIIYDLWRHVFYYIPNSLYEILIEYSELDIDQLVNVYGEYNLPVIKEYMSFLQEKELVHDKNGDFLSLSLDYETPSLLDNAVVDIDHHMHNFYRIKEEFESVGVSAILLRFWHNSSFELFCEIIELMSKGSHSDLQILIPYELNLQIVDLKQTCLFSPLLTYICVYNSPCNKRYKCYDVVVEHVVTDFVDETSCGNICVKNFTINSLFFIESLKYNNCLYKKVAIDKNGYVKNCPSMSHNFGLIDKVSLMDVVRNKEFISLWKITKDMITECNGCEYRYMCVDCRAYRVDNSIYSKPLKCKYIVDKCKWNV